MPFKTSPFTNDQFNLYPQADYKEMSSDSLQNGRFQTSQWLFVTLSMIIGGGNSLIWLLYVYKSNGFK